MPRTLIIGLGSRERGDDSVGLEVARRLRSRVPEGVLVLEREGGMASGLLEAWLDADDVVVVDSCASGGRPGTVHRFDAGQGALPTRVLRACARSWGVAEAVEIARSLDQLPARLVVFAVEGQLFRPGRRLSPRVEAAARDVVELVLDELTATRGEAVPAELVES